VVFLSHPGIKMPEWSWDLVFHATQRWPERMLFALLSPIEALPPQLEAFEPLPLYLAHRHHRSIHWNRVDDLIARLLHLVYRAA
jgi:hypothetical protein